MKAVREVERRYYKYKYPAQGYREISSLTSSGTQYIDTGVGGNSCSKVDLTLITPTSSNYTNEEAIFGSSWSTSGFFFMFYNNKFRWHSGGNYVDTSTITLDTRYNCICTKTSLIINGTSYSISGTGSNSTNNITIFTPTPYYGVYTLERFNMYDTSSKLIREYVPCKRLSDNVIGLYDKVNNKFYTNSGSGSFTGGNYVVEESTIDDYDYYIDFATYKLPKIENKYYGINR